MVAASKTAKRPEGVVIGRRQLAEARCACIKERKATQCDCEQCTQITLSLERFNKARPGWHNAYAATNGGKGCTCPLHDYSSEAMAAAAACLAALGAEKEAAARQAEAVVWAVHAPSGSQLASQAAAMATQAEAAVVTTKAAADAAMAMLAVAKLRVERYASMSTSEEALMVALLPCGKKVYPEQTVTGEKTFKCYARACCEDNCPNKGNLFERRKGSACGYALVFEGFVCPIDNSDAELIWQRWEKMLRNKNEDRETDDGKAAKASYSMELVPHRGTRAEFMTEMFGLDGKVRLWLPHKRRVRWCRQARRVLDDHKSGAREAAAANVVAACSAARAAAQAQARAATPRLDALRLVARVAPWVSMGVVAASIIAPAASDRIGSRGVSAEYAVVLEQRRIPLTLAALVRLAGKDDADGAAATAVAAAEAALTAATGKARTAAEVHALMALTATVQSDYASQFETYRIHTGTCAQPERHNMLVTIVGYKPYVEMMKKQGRGRKNSGFEPVQKQHVDIFYAFHKAGFKPSARSFNVVQACK